MSSTTHGTPQFGASEHSVGAQSPLPPAPPSRPGTPGKAISIVGIVLGGLALLLSWVPIVNNLAFVLGLVGLVLGVIGLVLAIRKRGAKALSIIAVVLSVLSLVVVFATQAFYSAVLDDVSDALDESTGESSIESVVDTGTEHDGVEEPGSDDGEATEQPTDSPASTSLALGDQATAGRYAVTVEAVDLDATDAVVAANTFNDAPENGRYATADLAVTFEGDVADEGMPLFDLDVELLGGDQRNYATYECMASLGDVSEQTDGLRAGGSSSFQVCFDIPEAAAEGAEVRVADQLDFGSDPVVWAIP